MFKFFGTENYNQLLMEYAFQLKVIPMQIFPAKINLNFERRGFCFSDLYVWIYLIMLVSTSRECQERKYLEESFVFSGKLFPELIGMLNFS